MEAIGKVLDVLKMPSGGKYINRKTANKLAA
jgi:hypothetical protein